ncbi:MAG: NAD-dependent epimerase [Methylophilus sp.]|nr:NAD-dependent epimerase [Methylophilus sp.]
MKVIVTGVAGFIGFYVCQQLLARGDEVIGIDNLNDYYDVSLKRARLASIQQHPQASQFSFIEFDMADTQGLLDTFAKCQPQRVVHLAAQAGVRYSLKNPHAYSQSNLVAFTNVLEACRHYAVEHLVYASSSSVYGGNTKMPFSEQDSVDHPVSLYAATKKANELMAHTYSHLYQLPTTGLRFFTVYGPWGRPDMSPFLFADAIFNNRPIKVFNHGDMLRDFTYIDDIVEGVIRVLDKPATPDADFDASNPNSSTSHAPYRIFNIGNSQPEKLLDFIGFIEEAIGKTAQKEFLPMQAGDVKATYADTSALEAWVGFKPNTSLKAGVHRFVDWYRQYYSLT